MATKTNVTKKDNLVYATPKLTDVLRATVQPSGQRNTPYAGTNPTTGRAINQPGGVSKTATYEGGIMTKDANGNLTDYGASLERQNVNYAGMEAPNGFNAKIDKYGGQTPTYEAYAANAQMNSQAFTDRATWERMMGESGTSYMSGTGGTGTLVSGGTVGTSIGNTNITALRQQQIDALRAKLGIQKAASQSSILSDADRAKQAVNTAYQQSIAGQKESLVNQGLASGVAGNDQSGIARTQMLQGQLAAENQQNAIGVQASADVNALETQYNTLLAQGESEAAQQLIDDAYKQQQADLENQRYTQQYNDQAKQYADTIAARNQTQANYEADLKYKKEQDAIQMEQQQAETDYNRAKYDEEFAYKQYQDTLNYGLKEKNYKLNVQKAKQAYETAKSRTAIALKNSNKKKGGSTKTPIDLTGLIK